MNKILILVSVLAGAILSVSGCENTEAFTLPVSKPVVRNTNSEASGKKWIDMMAAMLPNKLCKNDPYFRGCFKTTEQECEIQAVQAVHTCLTSHQEAIKADFRTRGPDVRPLGKTWGSKIGQCAATAYEFNLRDKAVNSAKCGV